MKWMKSGNTCWHTVPVELWTCLRARAMDILASPILEIERMPKEWRSVVIPILKNKGDMQSCSNCRGIKLMSHAIKLWGRVIEARLKEELVISDSSTVNALNVFV